MGVCVDAKLYIKMDLVEIIVASLKEKLGPNTLVTSVWDNFG